MKQITKSFKLLALISIISLIAGMHLIVEPENVSLIIVRGVGFLWVLEGVGALMDIKIKSMKQNTKDKSMKIYGSIFVSTIGLIFVLGSYGLINSSYIFSPEDLKESVYLMIVMYLIPPLVFIVPLYWIARQRIEYIIKSGRHRSVFRWWPFISGNLRFEFAIGMEHSNLKGRYSHINKIFGFSDGGLWHHKNSFRLGFIEKDGRCEVYTYCYVDGELQTQHIYTDDFGVARTCEVLCTEDRYQVLISGKLITTVPRGQNRRFNGYKHLLYPYFGGKFKTPIDLTYRIIKK